MIVYFLVMNSKRCTYTDHGDGDGSSHGNGG